jgi:hypothetical protein
MDEPTDDTDELPRDTHLQPTYRPDWGNSNPDWEDGQIHLEGELDFPADQPAREVATALIERSEQIGAIVSHDKTSGHIDAYPWNGPGFFRLSYDTDDPEARVSEIVVFDGDGKPAEHDTVQELKEVCERAKRIADRIVSAQLADDSDL